MEDIQCCIGKDLSFMWRCLQLSITIIVALFTAALTLAKVRMP